MSTLLRYSSKLLAVWISIIIHPLLLRFHVSLPCVSFFNQGTFSMDLLILETVDVGSHLGGAAWHMDHVSFHLDHFDLIIIPNVITGLVLLSQIQRM
jgi:hypothetical protein